VDYSTIPLGLGMIFAFFGGLVSFISPCVLPLVPAYIGYMGGRVTQTVAAQGGGNVQLVRANRWSTLMNGVAFVAGFTLVFMLLGLSLNVFIRTQSGANVSVLKDVIGRIGGVVIIFLGLHFMGVLPELFARLRKQESLLNNPLISIVVALLGVMLLTWGFNGTVALWDGVLWEQARAGGTIWIPIVSGLLVVIWLLVLFLGGAFFTPGAFWTRAMNTIEYMLYADTRREMPTTAQPGLLSSALIGIVFAAGWTPCIGPIYGSILTVTASVTRSVAESALWLIAYCIGLGIPFLLTAFMLDNIQGLLRALQQHMKAIKFATGAALVIIGVLIASGRLQYLSQLFAQQFGEFSVSLETSVQDNLEQLFGIQSSANTQVTTTPISQLPSTGPIRLDGTPSASDDESALSMFVEDDSAEPIVGLATGNTAPNFVTETDASTPLALYDLRGKVVLLNFWSETCEVCAAQVATYQSLVSENADFTVVTFVDGAGLQTLIDYREQWGISFTLALDSDGAIHTLYSVMQYPMNYLISRDGVIVQAFGDLPADEIRTLITNTLNAAR
jgi:cytochrome c-type biogenesis protein